MSRLRTLLFRRSALRRLLFTTSPLSTRITAYDVPPSAMNSAAVAVTFEYDKCFRNELSTVRDLGRARRILAGETVALSDRVSHQYDHLDDA